MYIVQLWKKNERENFLDVLLSTTLLLVCWKGIQRMHCTYQTAILTHLLEMTTSSSSIVAPFSLLPNSKYTVVLRSSRSAAEDALRTTEPRSLPSGENHLMNEKKTSLSTRPAPLPEELLITLSYVKSRQVALSSLWWYSSLLSILLQNLST